MARHSSAPQSKENEKKKTEDAEAAPNAFVAWWQKAWADFCNFFTGKTNAVEASSVVVTKADLEAEEKDFAFLQSLIDEMMEIAKSLEKGAEMTQEEKEEVVKRFIHALSKQKEIQESLWKVHQHFASIEIKQRKALEKEFNGLVDKYVRNKDSATAAEYVNIGATAVSATLAVASLILGFATGGVSVAIAGVLFGLQCASSIVQGTAGMTEAITKHKSDVFTGEMGKNKFHRDGTQQNLQSLTEKDMARAMQEIFELVKQMLETVRNQRHATRQIFV
jgi:hypothetical protein